MQPANTNIAMAAESEDTDGMESVPFYQRGSLKSLLSPVSEEEFRARYWEKKPLIEIAKDKQLMAYKHKGFWKCMDAIRDKVELEEIWDSGKAPWKVWK